MNRFLKFTLAAGTAVVLTVAVTPVRATTYAGNGSTSFAGPMGNGSLTVTNDGYDFAAGNGYVDFSYALSGNSLAGWENNIIIFIDNGNANGITNTEQTYSANSTDGGLCSVTQNNAQGSYNYFSFGGLMAPEYAIEMDWHGYGQIYSELGTAPFQPSSIDGVSPGNTSGGGLSYNVSGDTCSINIPVSEIGLSLNTVQNITLASIGVNGQGNNASQEGTETINGSYGYNANQTLGSVDTFQVVPEPSSLMLLLGSSAFGSFYLMRRRRK